MPVLNISKKMVIVGLILLICCSAFFYYNYLLLQPASKLLGVNVQQVIFIKSGSTINDIAKKLREKKLIAYPSLFKFQVRLTGTAPKLKAGYYRLGSQMTVGEIINKLVKGEMATYKLTVPEGTTIEKIALQLEKKGIKKEKFLSIARTKDLDYLSISLKNKKKIIYSLEGFLFPDTYQIPYGSSASEIIEIMLKEFKEKIGPLKSEIQDNEYNLKEIITIASLIQAEGKIDNELKIISSVIYNRLNIRMKLQMDATIQYVLPERKARLLYSDLKVDSPYNTYLHYGLPPGPINNPGLAAIKAALNPADTDYLYYVVVGDDGQHKFSKNYRQHLKIQNDLEAKEKQGGKHE